MSSVEIIFNNEKNFVRIKFSGKMSVDFLLNGCDKAIEDSRYKYGMHRIWDVREADLTDITTEQVKEITSYLNDRTADLGKVRVAVVAEGSLGYGLARVFSSFSDITTENEVIPCKSVEEAENFVCGEKS